MAENSKIDNGGPAFPSRFLPEPGIFTYPGMSLRDWFAGQALQGARWEDGTIMYPVRAAQYAYQLADAMLAERAKIGGAK